MNPGNLYFIVVSNWTQYIYITATTFIWYLTQAFMRNVLGLVYLLGFNWVAPRAVSILHLLPDWVVSYYFY